MTTEWVFTPQKLANYNSRLFHFVSLSESRKVNISQCTTGDDRGAGSEKQECWKKKKKKDLLNCKTVSLAFLTLLLYTKAGSWQLDMVCYGLPKEKKSSWTIASRMAKTC